MKTKAKYIVDALLDPDDPQRYVNDTMPFKEAFEVVVKKAGGRCKWEHRSGNSTYCLVNYPRSINFNKLLREHGLGYDNAMGISRGSKTERVQYLFTPERLNSYVQRIV